MSDPDADAIVRTYFRRLDEVLSGVPRDRRDQLLEELRDHVSQARAALAVESPAAVREILERIGSPEEIVAEEANVDPASSGIVAYLFRRSSVSTMTEASWSVIGAIAGLLFVIAYLVSMLVAPSAPDIDASAFTVTSYFSLNVHSLLASGLIGVAATVVLLVFLGAVHRVVGRDNSGGGIPSSIVLASGVAFAAVGAVGAIFTTSLAMLGGQASLSAASGSYVQWAFVTRTILGTGVFGLLAALLLASLAVGLLNAGLVGRWFGLLCAVLAACNALGGGAALILGTYSRFWMVIQTVGMFGVAFAVLATSAVLVGRALPAWTGASLDRDEAAGVAAGLSPARWLSPRSRLLGAAALIALAVAAAIAVPLLTRGSDADLAIATTPSAGASGSSQSGQSTSPSASVGYDGSAICAPTTDAATSGGSPTTLMSAATQVASGTIEGKAWSLWSAKGESGATGLEDGGLVFDGAEYGLCAGYPNPSETEMIDTGGDAIIYGVVNYPGLAQVQISTGEINTFAVGTVLPAPHVEVVNGVSFYIGTLPQSACSYNYFEINTTSASYSAQHNIGFGGDGVGQGYSITNNPGNAGACVAGKLDPLSYSEGQWELPPGQFSSN